MLVINDVNSKNTSFLFHLCQREQLCCHTWRSSWMFYVRTSADKLASWIFTLYLIEAQSMHVHSKSAHREDAPCNHVFVTGDRCSGRGWWRGKHSPVWCQRSHQVSLCAVCCCACSVQGMLFQIVCVCVCVCMCVCVFLYVCCSKTFVVGWYICDRV